MLAYILYGFSTIVSLILLGFYAAPEIFNVQTLLEGARAIHSLPPPAPKVVEKIVVDVTSPDFAVDGVVVSVLGLFFAGFGILAVLSFLWTMVAKDQEIVLQFNETETASEVTETPASSTTSTPNKGSASKSKKSKKKGKALL